MTKTTRMPGYTELGDAILVKTTKIPGYAEPQDVISLFLPPYLTFSLNNGSSFRKSHFQRVYHEIAYRRSFSSV